MKRNLIKQTPLALVGLLCVSMPLALVPVQAIAQRESSPFATQDPLARALQANSVVIGKSKQGQVDENALRALVANRPPDRPVKIVVANGLPASGAKYGSRGTYTKALHDFLNMGQGLLIIVTDRGIAVASDSLPSSVENDIAQRHAAELQSNFTSGIQSIIGDYDGALDAAGNAGTAGAAPNGDTGVPPMDYGEQREPSGSGGWLLPVAAVGGVGALVWAGSRAAKKKKAVSEARIPVERLRGEVVTGISYADTYLDLLPPSQDATTAREARQRAAGLLEQAKGIAQSANSAEDYGRAEALLEQANQEIATCRKHIDIATGGTGMAVGINGTDYKATPASATGTPTSQAAPVVNIRAEDIPEKERGACFFCSRPQRISEMTPVTVTLNGQRRKVLACADDVRIIQQGATPEVRTVQDSGQSVPWYRSSRYDPYRDYGRTEVVYMPGYGYPGYGGGFYDGLMWGTLLSQPAPMPYPVFVSPQGYATANPIDSAPQYYGQNGGMGYASNDFAGNGNPAFAPDNSGSNDMGGYGSADFFGTSGNDFGGSDFNNPDGNVGFAGANSGYDFGTAQDSGGSDYAGADSALAGADAGIDAGNFGYDSSDSNSSSDFGGSDYSSDSSSSWDSGGSDFGGSDFSSDSGSSDSGGGSDF